MNQDGVFTMNLSLDLNWALVECYTQDILSNWDLDITDFTREEIAQAWLAAIQHRLDLIAEDSDRFLCRNSTEKCFFQALLHGQDTPREWRDCGSSLVVV